MEIDAIKKKVLEDVDNGFAQAIMKKMDKEVVVVYGKDEDI